MLQLTKKLKKQYIEAIKQTIEEYEAGVHKESDSKCKLCLIAKGLSGNARVSRIYCKYCIFVLFYEKALKKNSIYCINSKLTRTQPQTCSEERKSRVKNRIRFLRDKFIPMVEKLECIDDNQS